MYVKVRRRTNKSLLQIFKKLDFYDKCGVISASFGMIAFIIFVIWFIIVSFNLGIGFGIISILLLSFITPLFISFCWSFLDDCIFEQLYESGYDWIDEKDKTSQTE